MKNKNLVYEAMKSLSRAMTLREKRANANRDLAINNGMSEERYVQSIMNELDEALSAYRNMLYNQAEYEMKNNRPSPYQKRTVREYIEVFNSAGDDFDRIMSDTYNIEKGYDLEQLALAIEKNLENKKCVKIKK